MPSSDFYGLSDQHTYATSYNGVGGGRSGGDNRSYTQNNFSYDLPSARAGEDPLAKDNSDKIGEENEYSR